MISKWKFLHVEHADSVHSECRYNEFDNILRLFTRWLCLTLKTGIQNDLPIIKQLCIISSLKTYVFDVEKKNAIKIFLRHVRFHKLNSVETNRTVSNGKISLQCNSPHLLFFKQFFHILDKPKSYRDWSRKHWQFWLMNETRAMNPTITRDGLAPKKRNYSCDTFVMNTHRSRLHVSILLLSLLLLYRIELTFTLNLYP